MARKMCDVCGARPATTAIRRIVSGGGQRVEHLCDVHAAQVRGGRSSLGGGGLFDDFFDQFFDAAGGTRRIPIEQEPTGRRAEQVDVTSFFSEPTSELLRRAVERAMEWGNADLTTEHLLHAALEDDLARHVLEWVDGDPDAVSAQLEDEADKGASTDSSPTLAPDAKRALLTAYEESRALGSSYIGPEHVLLALARDEESEAGRMLSRFGVSHTKLRGAIVRGVGERGEAREPESSTPTVDEFSRDLTQMAREGKLDPVIGREDEIETTIEILSRRTKNNPVLIGDPGVGKTAIVEGIAQRIVNGEVPETLSGKRVLALDLSGIVAGTQYRGQFEERLKKVIDEIRESSEDQIVFIDELHTVVGAGAAGGSMDASNMLKPALARGELHCIGATTIDEYRKNIEKDAALERRFQPVLVGEPSVDDAIEILRGLKDRYEAHHRVKISEEAILAAAELSDRYITDRFLPDKAIDLVDQASARVRLRSKTKPQDTRELEEGIKRLKREKAQAISAEKFEKAQDLKGQIQELQDRLGAFKGARQPVAEVTAEDIAEVVSRATGIPVSQLTEEERERLLRLEHQLHERVVGQEEAVDAVAEAIRRARAGLSDPNRPIGSFLFLGPTGVGKTELARTLAEALFGEEAAMVRIDMSEFQERHTVSRLVGAPPGYVGYEEAGQLTESVRRRPYSVLLLDEIEKAHPDVFNILLQILDDGRLTDSQGRTVDFKNAVIIMTSNLGAERIQAHARRNESFEELKEDMEQILKRSLRPEFLNRIDEVIVFRALTREQIADIAGLLLERTRRRLKAQDVEVEFTDEAVGLVAEEGFDPEFGARPLRRTIQRRVDNQLSRMILDGSLEPGDRLVVGAQDGELAFDVIERATVTGGAG
ncbi:MAG: ATP-dependent Clp protease ATP-binding subunit [Actinomycetota bacterium]|nr:ATP-dependent Clp protease ATP-binding subunit [Actinomycetota bacterium]